MLNVYDVDEDMKEKAHVVGVEVMDGMKKFS